MKYFLHKETNEIVKLTRNSNGFYLVHEYTAWQRKWNEAYYVSESSYPDWLTNFKELKIKGATKQHDY